MQLKVTKASNKLLTLEEIKYGNGLANNMPLSLSLTSRFLSALGKLTSLGFVWFQGKNIQSSGTIKNHSLSSLLLNLKPNITFAKPVKNGVAQKNEYGGRISTQLDIRNLNQIGSRTEETLGSGEETLGNGEQTSLRSEEAFESGEEPFLNCECILLIKRSTQKSGIKIYLKYNGEKYGK